MSLDDVTNGVCLLFPLAKSMLCCWLRGSIWTTRED